MDLDVGYVCSHCDSYAPLGATQCPRCARPMGFDEKPPAPFRVPMPAPVPVVDEPGDEPIEAEPLPSPDQGLG